MIICSQRAPCIKTPKGSDRIERVGINRFHSTYCGAPWFHEAKIPLRSDLTKPPCLSNRKREFLCWHWKWHKANTHSVSDTKDPKDKHVRLNKWITCSPWQSSFLHLWDFGVCQVLTATPGRVNRSRGEGVCWLILWALRAESLFPTLHWLLDSFYEARLYAQVGMLIKSVLAC